MHTAKIKINSNTYSVKHGKNIFDELKFHSVELPHSCLSGSCGACRVEVMAGAQNLDSPGDKEATTLKNLEVNYKRIHGPDFLEGKTIRLSCQAKVLGDIEIKEIN